jgi:triosephosphate isomerase
MKYLLVANWKMYLTYEQEIAWAQTYGIALIEVAQQAEAQIILCPSFVSIATFAAYFSTSSIKIGAQNCSAHQAGSYTGQVAAQSLAQAGCSYVLIGHSERRTLHHEAADVLISKLKQAYENNLIPLLCIGESQDLYERQQTLMFLEQELKILPPLKSLNPAQLIIAYEPQWAIGTNIIPIQQELTHIIEVIKRQVTEYLPQTKITLLYGGSVNKTTVTTLQACPNLDGFLIGKASIDFQTFKKILSGH